jgi:hypothetical protein
VDSWVTDFLAALARSWTWQIVDHHPAERDAPDRRASTEQERKE